MSFWRTLHADGRWWLTDPSGARTTTRGINTVDEPAGRDLLLAHGFNTAGAWSDDVGLPYTPILSMLTSYPPVKPLAKNNPMVMSGVFGDDFEAHVSDVIRRYDRASDEQLIGYFTDNELPLDPARIWDAFIRNGVPAAKKWKRDHGSAAGFFGFLMETYFTKVASGIKAVDPNHLILGTRFNDFATASGYFKAAGRHIDVLSVNYYHQSRTVDHALIAKWANWSGLPVLPTEFYAMANDTHLPNDEGAGIEVATQQDRANYYKRFVNSCKTDPNCIGWHWFKYRNSERSNKGIVDKNGAPYTVLLDQMAITNAA